MYVRYPLTFNQVIKKIELREKKANGGFFLLEKKIKLILSYRHFH